MVIHGLTPLESMFGVFTAAMKQPHSINTKKYIKKGKIAKNSLFVKLEVRAIACKTGAERAFCDDCPLCHHQRQPRKPIVGSRPKGRPAVFGPTVEDGRDASRRVKCHLHQRSGILLDFGVKNIAD